MQQESKGHPEQAQPLAGEERIEDHEPAASLSFGSRSSDTIQYAEVRVLRRRFVAFILDVFIAALVSVFVLLLVTVALVFFEKFDDDGVIEVFFLSSLIITYLAYHLFYLTAFGATPGKLLLKLRVVDSYGRELRFRRSVIRLLGYIVSLCSLCLGFFHIIIDPLAQGWHDKIAGTYVIYEGS